MIPELGHFALILALLLALVQGILPLAGRRAQQSGVDGGRQTGRSRPVSVCRHRLWCLAYSFLSQRFFGCERDPQLPFPPP